MTYLHDVFISHASEDKEKFVRPLAKELENRDYDVWYDELSLTVGDTLLDSINKAIEQSRYGIVVLSYPFFNKDWPQKELKELTKLEKDGRKVILPILHEISLQEVSKYSEELAGKVAIKTSITTIEKVVDELAIVLGTPLKNSSITPQEPDNKPISKDFEMDGLKLELSQNDIITLTNLLKRSGFVSSHPGRRGLCQSIGVDPNSINYLENISSEDFAALLINELFEQENQDALCKICQKLDHKYKNGQYKKTLEDIKVKINCN